MRNKIVMKMYDTLEDLKNKREELIATAENDIIKSITGYDFYLNAFYSVFKV